MRKFTELSLEEQTNAKEMYLAYDSVTDIAQKYNVLRTSISYHANTYWKKDRDLLRADLFASFSELKRATFTKMSESAIKVMTKALQHVADREEPPTMREAKDVSVILEALDKITRLDEGKPTDILEERPFSTIELQRKINMDPFAGEGIEDANFKEITDETKEEPINDDANGSNP